MPTKYINKEEKNSYRRFRLRIVCALTVCAYLVALIVVGLHTQLGQAADTIAMIAISRLNFASLNLVSRGASLPLLAILAATIALIALCRKRFPFAIRAVLIIVAANATTQILKFCLDRPYLGVGYDLDNSFPSGHATFSASLGVALIVVAPAGFRVIAASFSWLWIVVMGFSVIQQGWHRPGDVLGAICVCVFWGLLLAPQENRERRLPKLRKILFSSATCLFVSSLLILVVALIAGASTLLWSHSQLQLVDFAQTNIGHAITLSASLLILGTAGLGCATIDLLCSPRNFSRSFPRSSSQDPLQSSLQNSPKSPPQILP